jgi:hypothetical protein
MLVKRDVNDFLLCVCLRDCSKKNRNGHQVCASTPRSFFVASQSPLSRQRLTHSVLRHWPPTFGAGVRRSRAEFAPPLYELNLTICGEEAACIRREPGGVAHVAETQ